MDYRMEHRERQQFIVLVRSFPNEIINDDSDHRSETPLPDIFRSRHTHDKAEGAVKIVVGHVHALCHVSMAGVASIYSHLKEVSGTPVVSLFDTEDLPGYASYPQQDCPLCREGHIANCLLDMLD